MILRYLGTRGDGREYVFRDAMTGRDLAFPNTPESIAVEGQAPLDRHVLYRAPEDVLDRVSLRPAKPADVVAARRAGR